MIPLNLSNWPFILWIKDLLGSFQNLGVIDSLDIFVVAGFLYVGYLWLKHTRASRVAQGIFVLGILYLVANQTGMILTTSIFRAFFTILLLALVVIFQDDLKRFFERITIWRWRTRDSSMRRDVVEPLVRSMTLFAQQKIGALMVIKGTDPLDRHMDGGHALRGELCSPLLESLFDPHSDGHDGAVIIDGNRVTHFGVHLPLSRNLDQLSGNGTRHAAALGLSELTDALCLVVSEQKGTISAARDGLIRTLPHRKALETQIAAYCEAHAMTPARRGWLDFVLHNLTVKGACVLVALGLWLVFVQGFKPMEQKYTCVVRYEGLPDTLRIRTITPREIVVTVAGLKRDFTRFRAPRVVVNADDAVAGITRLPVDEDDVELPPQLRVTNLEPPSVELVVSSIPTPVIRTPRRAASQKGARRWFPLR